MRVVEYNLQSDATKSDLLSQMEKCDWDVADYLHWLIKNNELEKACGENPRVLMLVEGDKLASFCTYVKFDEIDDEIMKPWAGFVYTFPDFRGKRCAGQLLDYASSLAAEEGYEYLYVSSEEKGLYEKYGFEFVRTMRSIHGYDTGIFRRLCKSE